MDSTSWLKQGDTILFEDVLWSRPENKRFAGKLLIIGGHKQSFNAVSDAYAAALKSGIGTARVILPQSLKSMLKTVFPEAEFAPSNPIGSFSRDALATWLEAAEWADGVLLAGDFGRNSETAVLIDSFIKKYEGPLGITGDAIEYFNANSGELLQTYNAVITAGVDKLQKLALPQTALRQQDDLAQLVQKLSKLTDMIEANLVTHHAGNVLVARYGKVSTTLVNDFEVEKAAAYSIVWLLQQPQKPFEALTTAAYCYASNQSNGGRGGT